MQNIYKTFIIINTLLYVVMGWASWWYLSTNYQLQFIAFMPVIPVVFYSWALVSEYIILKNEKKSGGKLANLYFLLKVLKNLIAGVLIVVLFFKYDTELTLSLITLGVFYMVNLVIETIYVTKMEKEMKKNENNA